MKMRQVVGVLALLGVGVFLNSCSRKTIPEKAKAVQNFEKEKYLGKWYEIARLDFKFEKGLNNTSAEYSLNDNGGIKVDNKGYDVKNDKWKQSIGKAKFVGDENVAMLKVSFFGPFSYHYSGTFPINLRALFPCPCTPPPRGGAQRAGGGPTPPQL